MDYYYYYQIPRLLILLFLKRRGTKSQNKQFQYKDQMMMIEQTKFVNMLWMGGQIDGSGINNNEDDNDNKTCVCVFASIVIESQLIRLLVMLFIVY